MLQFTEFNVVGNLRAAMLKNYQAVNCVLSQQVKGRNNFAQYRVPNLSKQEPNRQPIAIYEIRKSQLAQSSNPAALASVELVLDKNI